MGKRRDGEGGRGRGGGGRIGGEGEGGERDGRGKKETCLDCLGCFRGIRG